MASTMESRGARLAKNGHWPLLGAAIAVVAMSCGGSVTSTNGAGGASSTSSSSNSTSSTSSTSSSSSSASSSGANSGCPGAQPSGACSMPGLSCSYGDQIPITCRAEVTCSNGAWQEQPGPKCDPTQCPAQAPAEMSACTSEGAQCGFGDGTVCVCTKCVGGGFCMPLPSPVWSCGGPPQQAGCPPIAPNEGTACAQPKLSCYYAPSCIAPMVLCMNGAWFWEQIACGG